MANGSYSSMKAISCLSMCLYRSVSEHSERAYKCGCAPYLCSSSLQQASLQDHILSHILCKFIFVMVFLSAIVHKVFYQVLVVKFFLEGSCRDLKWQGRFFFSLPYRNGEFFVHSSKVYN